MAHAKDGLPFLLRPGYLGFCSLSLSATVGEAAWRSVSTLEVRARFILWVNENLTPNWDSLVCRPLRHTCPNNSTLAQPGQFLGLRVSCCKGRDENIVSANLHAAGADSSCVVLLNDVVDAGRGRVKRSRSKHPGSPSALGLIRLPPGFPKAPPSAQHGPEDRGTTPSGPGESRGICSGVAFCPLVLEVESSEGGDPAITMEEELNVGI